MKKDAAPKTVLMVDLDSTPEEVNAALSIIRSAGFEVETSDYGYAFESVEPPWMVNIIWTAKIFGGMLVYRAFSQIFDKMLDPYTDKAVDEIHSVIRKLQYLSKSIYETRHKMSRRSGSVVVTIEFVNPETGELGELELPLLLHASLDKWEKMMNLEIRNATMLYIESEGEWISEKERLDQMMRDLESDQ